MVFIDAVNLPNTCGSWLASDEGISPSIKPEV
jgi:hypothetical protein